MDKALVVVFYHNSRLVCGEYRKWIIAILCMTMPIIGMDNEFSSLSQEQLEWTKRCISIFNYEGCKQVMNAAVYFTLADEPMQNISFKDAINYYPDFKFNEQVTNNIFKIEIQKEVKIVNVVARSVVHQNKYSFWVPYEFILNDDEEIKIKTNDDAVPINVKCDRSKKICLRLLATLKIEAQHRIELGNFNTRITNTGFSDAKIAQQKLSDALQESEDSFKRDLKQRKEEYQKTLKSIEEELEKEKLEVKNLLAQNEEKIEALNNEKNQKEQFVITKNSEIESLNNKIEKITKETKELSDSNRTLWNKYAQKKEAYDLVVWHKRLFAIAFLVCLASLIGCVLKMNHVFV